MTWRRVVLASGVDEEERREGGTTGEGRRGESSRVIWPVQVPRGSLYESASEGEEGKRTEQKTNLSCFCCWSPVGRTDGTEGPVPSSLFPSQSSLSFRCSRRGRL